MAELVDYLTEDEIGTLAEFLKDAKAITTGKGPLANEVSRIISKAPKYDTETVIYKYLKPRKEWEGAGEFKEPGFIIGADIKNELPKTDGATLFQITVPAGVPLAWLPGGAYLLDRGYTVDFDGSRGMEAGSKADVYASLKVGKSLTAAIRFNTGYIPPEAERNSEWGSLTDEDTSYHAMQEFHQEHDQKSHGGGGQAGLGGVIGPRISKETQRANRRQKLRNVKETLGNIASVVGSVLLIATGVASAGLIIHDSKNLRDAAGRLAKVKTEEKKSE